MVATVEMIEAPPLVSPDEIELAESCESVLSVTEIDFSRSIRRLVVGGGPSLAELEFESTRSSSARVGPERREATR